MAGKSVTQYLIRVNIILGPFGVPKYSYNTSPNDDASQQGVDTGDQVAWYLQVLPPRRAQILPPYRLDFQDPSFYGTSSLSVPEGGFSPYLPVRTIRGLTKYSVTAHGVFPPDDPQIQTHNFPLIIAATATPRPVGISWNSTAGSSPSANVNGHHQPFPLTLHPGDVVTFTAGQPFDVIIATASPNANVPSPFDGPTVIDGQNNTTGGLTVGSDAVGYKYTMYFVLLSDGTTRSADFEIDVAAPSKGRK